MSLVYQENNGFGPVSESRKKNATIASAILIIIYAAVVATYRWHNFLEILHFEDVGLCSAIISSIVLGEVVRRSALYAEEINHVEKRYQGHYTKALMSCLEFGEGTNAVSLFRYLLKALI